MQEFDKLIDAGPHLLDLDGLPSRVLSQGWAKNTSEGTPPRSLPPASSFLRQLSCSPAFIFANGVRDKSLLIAPSAVRNGSAGA